MCLGVKPDDSDLTLIVEESSSSEEEARPSCSPAPPCPTERCSQSCFETPSAVLLKSGVSCVVLTADHPKYPVRFVRGAHRACGHAQSATARIILTVGASPV